MNGEEKKRREKEKDEEGEYEISSFTQACFDRGDAFELDCLAQLREEKKSKVIDLTDLSDDEIVRAIEECAASGASTVLYQPGLKVDCAREGAPAWCSAFSSASVHLSKCMPDFVFFENGVFTIVDAKCSSRERLSHHIQVAVYILILRAWLAQFSASSSPSFSSLRVSLYGGIWLPDDPSTFSSTDLSLIVEKLESFLTVDVPRIALLESVDAAEWRLRPSCGHCFNVNQCRSEVTEKHLIGQVPYLKGEDFAFLASLKSAKPGALTKLVDIEDLVNNDNVNLNNHSKSRLRKILYHSDVSSVSPVSISMKENVVQAKPGRASFHFPRSESFQIVITCLTDPASVLPRCYAWAIQIFSGSAGGEVPASLKAVKICTSRAEVARAFVAHLHHCFRALEGSTIALFFYSEREHRLATAMILEEALNGNSDVAKALALTLTRAGELMKAELTASIIEEQCAPTLKEKDQQWKNKAKYMSNESLPANLLERLAHETIHPFQSFWRAEALQLLDANGNLCDPLLNAEQIDKSFQAGARAEQMDREDFLRPKVALIENTVIDLLLLPVAGFYRFHDVFLNFSSSAEKNQMNQGLGECSESNLFEIWVKEAESSNFILGLNSRLRCLSSIIIGIRSAINQARGKIDDEKLKPSLLYDAGRIAVVEGLKIRDPLLAKLAFLEQTDALSKYEEVRRKRCKAWSDLLFDGEAVLMTCLEVRVKSPYKAQVACSLGLPSSHVRLEVGRSGQWLLFDYDESGLLSSRYFEDLKMNQSWKGPAATILKCEKGIVVLEFTGFWSSEKQTKEWPIVKQQYILLPRYLGLNFTIQIIEDLTLLDEEHGGEVKKIFTDPLTYGKAIDALAISKDTLSTEQLNLLDCNRLGLKSSQKQAFDAVLGQRVTGLWGPPGSGKTRSVSAIIVLLIHLHRLADIPFRVLIAATTNSAVETCLEKIRELREVQAGNAGVFPVFKLGKNFKGASINPASARDNGESPWICYGGTVFQIRKLGRNVKFDLIVVEEGSQVKLSTAAQALRFLKPEAGRVIVAGDHHQLEPIFSGDYSAFPDLIQSFLSLIVDKAPQLVCKLRENFRMNDELARFTQILYGADYESQEPGRVLPMNRVEPMPPGLSSTRSLVLVEIDRPEGIIDTEALAQYEAEEYVLKILQYFIQNFSGSGPAESQVLVVTPHHVQRRAVNRAFDMNNINGVFVDTAEKAQGKTAELVIICYSGPALLEEAAERDAQFLFVKNRLNVALSRARTKCILLLANNLKQLKINSIFDAGVREGYQFLRDLIKFE